MSEIKIKKLIKRDPSFAQRDSFADDGLDGCFESIGSLLRNGIERPRPARIVLAAID
jgi:hypothetical protein